MKTPQVSVIVPVRNEARAIRQTLECLLRQDFEPDGFEVLVVDGQSDDETVAIVREMQPRFGRLTLLYNPKRWSSAARNIGIRHASGEYIVIVDGHCAIDNPHYLRDLVRAFAETSADCLARPQPLDADGASPFQTGVALARRSWLGHNPDSAIFSDRPGFVEPQNVAVAYRRSVFGAVGLFDERFDACEDVEFNTRVHRHGLRCYFTPAIGVRYHPRSSLRGLWRQMYRYGTGRARLGRKHPLSRTIPSLIPPLWLVWLAGTLVAGLLWSPALAAFALCAVAYCALVLGESLRLTGGRLLPALRLPLIFFALHAGFGWGFLKESLAPAPTRGTARR
jgi:succinoglycan biosynthesis protein ExoA